jgi:hypothetical protein
LDARHPTIQRIPFYVHNSGSMEIYGYGLASTMHPVNAIMIMKWPRE